MGCISKTSNKVLRAQARESLEGLWGLAIGVSVVYFVIIFPIGCIPFIGSIVSLFIASPIVLGLITFSLSLSRKQNPRFSQIFDGFKRYGIALGAYLLQTIFVLLWSILLIIPGIIASISYAMTFFIIADNDSIGPLEAIRKSKEMMRGNKWRFFCLQFSFFGWFLLSLLTLGIGFILVCPYMLVSSAKFYEDLIKKETV